MEMIHHRIDQWYVFDLPYNHPLVRLDPPRMQRRIRDEVLQWLNLNAPGKHRITYAGVTNINQVCRIKLRNRDLAVKFKLVWG